MEVQVMNKQNAVKGQTLSRGQLVEQFLKNSEQVESESLKVDRDLFIEAAEQDNVEFDFMQLKSFCLNKKNLKISNAKHALIEAEFGIVENGCVVFDATNPDVFLTVCMAETLHVVLPASKIVQSCIDIELLKGQSCDEGGGDITCVSGSTRKADIHRFGPQVKRTLVYVIEDL